LSRNLVFGRNLNLILLHTLRLLLLLICSVLSLVLFLILLHWLLDDWGSLSNSFRVRVQPQSLKLTLNLNLALGPARVLNLLLSLKLASAALFDVQRHFLWRWLDCIVSGWRSNSVFNGHTEDTCLLGRSLVVDGACLAGVESLRR